MMSHKCVVRNAQYKRVKMSLRQKHNERQHMDYINPDIVQERSEYNVHFKKPVSAYEEMFDTMVADKTISTRGLGKDPNIMDELIFGVNTLYFEENGGYEYAKEFFEEAYRCAVKVVGGEEYVLSAVMHADERNKALSEELGRDTFHYHLHVTYIPIVDKEIYYRKNNKNPELAGKLREVIKQVSHSKRWGKLKQYDEDGNIVRNSKGKPILLSQYSMLQDTFHDHMKDAGFGGFERGERGSTAEHLSVLEFKTKKESERAVREAQRADNEIRRADSFKGIAQLEQKAAATVTAIVEQKQELAKALDGVIVAKESDAAVLDDVIDDRKNTVAVLGDVIENKKTAVARLDELAEKRKKQIDDISAKAAIIKQDAVTFSEIDRMGDKRTIAGNVTLAPEDWSTVSELAKEGIRSRGIIRELKDKVSSLLRKITGLENKIESYESKNITDEISYQQAKKRAPRRLAEAIAEIMRKPPEREERELEKSMDKDIGRQRQR